MKNVNWMKAVRIMGVSKKEFERIREYVYDVEDYITENYFEKDDSIEDDYLDLYESLMNSHLILLTHKLMATKMKAANDINECSKEIWDLVCEQAKHYTFQGIHNGYHVYKRDDKIVRPVKESQVK
jgi:hypothetical protein